LRRDVTLNASRSARRVATCRAGLGHRLLRRAFRQRGPQSDQRGGRSAAAAHGRIDQVGPYRKFQTSTASRSASA